MNSSSSIAKIAPALLAAQKDMSDAKKDAKNPFFKSKYADLNSVREAVTPALHKNGISILQLNTPDSTGRNFVTTVLLHESGEFISSDTEIICKEASNPQALGSAISYARRYGLSSMLSVGASDDDGEAGTGRGTFTKSTPVLAPNGGPTKTTIAVASEPETLLNVAPKQSFRKPSKKTEAAPVANGKGDNDEKWMS